MRSRCGARVWSSISQTTQVGEVKTLQDSTLTYAALIGLALLKAPEHQLTVNLIYDYIEANFPEQVADRPKWCVHNELVSHSPTPRRNCIRHSLSKNKIFEKVRRRATWPQ